MKKLFSYFSKGEIALWASSVVLILISFALFDRINYLTLFASLIGVTSLIFNAKGNPFGQVQLAKDGEKATDITKLGNLIAKGNDDSTNFI